MKADEIMEEITKNYDKTIIEFLESEGYKVPNTITSKYLKELKEELEKQDKFIDTFEYIDYRDNTAKQYLIPFFNSISNPLSEEIKQQIIKKILKERGVLDE